MDLTEKNLPSNVEIDGRFYSIQTDYRLILKLLRQLKEGASLTMLYTIFEGNLPKKETGVADEAAALEALMDFISPKRELPRDTGEKQDKEILIDYDLDAELIYSAFMQEYHIDLFDVKKLHWHKFIALIAGLKNSKLVDIIGYRQYIQTGETDEHSKTMTKLKEAWRIISKEEKEQTEKATARFEEWLEGKRK